jgi:galactokinase
LKNLVTKIKVSTPGRVCLFGEHQDYLNLPIIASAISKRIFIEGYKRFDSMVNILMPDIGKHETFYLSGPLEYVLERDYIRSSINVLLREKFTFSKGFDCVIHGEIPINAGTSSSSALIVSWINFLARISDQAIELPSEEIALLAYKAEVEEFSEPGGMMDHYSTAIGGIIGLKSYEGIKIEKINAKLGAFVLGNSGEPKDTKQILARVKNGVIEIKDYLTKIDKEFSLQTVLHSDIKKYRSLLNADQYELLCGTIINRDITVEAEKVLKSEPIVHKKIGELLNKHQEVLRDILKISTPNIDRMIELALEAGAYGAKINGSGGGGCMFAYAPENPEKVMEAINTIAEEAFVIYSDNGTHNDNIEAVA